MEKPLNTFGSAECTVYEDMIKNLDLEDIKLSDPELAVKLEERLKEKDYE